MFNCKEDRVIYGNLLMPPTGYKLVRAVGTTYSLDLETLMSVCITLGIQEDTDSSLCSNPFAILKSLQNLRDKLLIFFDAGQLAPLNNRCPALMLLLDQIVVPVKLKGGANNYPSFHPKTWILHYENEAGEELFRFIVLSRNLTFDRSWDVVVSMDGKPLNRNVRDSYPLAAFLQFLSDNTLTDIKDRAHKRKIINELYDRILRVKFDIEDKHFHGFDILPLGIGSYDINEDPLMHDTFHDLLIVSPFVSASVISNFDTRRSIKGTKRHLITRSSELPKLVGKIDESFSIFTLKDAVVDSESLISEEDTSPAKAQDLHAKLYFVRKESESTLYIGSMNASHSGLNRNVEMMLKLKSKRRYLDLEKIESELFGREEKFNPFEKIDLSEIEKTEPEPDERADLERIMKEICRLKIRAKAFANGDKFSVKISISSGKKPLPKALIAPAKVARSMQLAEEILFEDLTSLQLSDLYSVQIRGEKESIVRMIIIPTEIPIDRDAMIIRSVLNSRRAFIDYITFILGDDYVLNAMECESRSNDGASELHKSSNIHSQPVIYEKMLKAAYNEPEKFREIGILIDKIGDLNVIPEEFTYMYYMFKNTLNIK